MPLSLTRRDSSTPTGAAVFSPKTAREVRSMLEWPSCQAARLPRRRSPATVWPARRAPRTSSKAVATRTNIVSSFVGFAPASDPRLIVAVMIDEPSAGKHYGGDVAAPVFASVMGNSLRTLGIAPDAPLVVAQSPKTPTPKARL
jgi:cell division protein FtsI (penicillin-binding protein 3)